MENFIKVEGGLLKGKIPIRDFELAETPVTFEEWIEYCVDTGKEIPSDQSWGHGNRPVININLFEMMEYCNWLSVKEGLLPFYTIDYKSYEVEFHLDRKGSYRLPSEQEWEWAARGGIHDQGFTYAGSNNLDEVGWYSGNSFMTHPVKSKKPNQLGFYDMSGNVWEATTSPETEKESLRHHLLVQGHKTEKV